MKFTQKKSGLYRLLLAPNTQDLNIAYDWFEPKELAKKGLIKHVMTGRAKVFFFSSPSESFESSTEVSKDTRLFALRHYYRGGLIAKFLRDQFVFTGKARTRSFKELTLLKYMLDEGLKVPKPIAARIIQKGLFYEADIITEVIKNAKELHQILLNNEVSEALWQAIGQSIKKMHTIGVCHDDINVKNVLIQTCEENQNIYLIDFDKCSRKSDGEWKKENIARFKRSITKQKALHENYYFSHKDWNAFSSGYNSL